VAKADVAELVDARDLKSLDGNVVWVRLPPPAPGRFFIDQTVYVAGAALDRIRLHRQIQSKPENDFHQALTSPSGNGNRRLYF
jgi:hypothetical protein